MLLSLGLVLGLIGSGAVTGQEITSVNVDELTPFNLNWNQVHFLVRESLADLDLLRREHEDIYRELQSCYGLEKCLDEFNLLNTEISSRTANYGAGSLLAELQRERESLHGQNIQLEAEMREKQRQIEWRRRQQQGQVQGQGQGNRDSYSSHFSSGSVHGGQHAVGGGQAGSSHYSEGQGQRQGQYSEGSSTGGHSQTRHHTYESINQGLGQGQHTLGGQHSLGGQSQSRHHSFESQGQGQGQGQTYRRTYEYSYEYNGDNRGQLGEGRSGARSSYDYERNAARSQSYGYNEEDGPVAGRG